MSTMTDSGIASLRNQILSDPSVILDDRQIVEALIQSQDDARGSNVVDMRGAALTHLESRLNQLQDTHQGVISAAYDQVTVTRQVHRALLMMVEPDTIEGFLDALDTVVADCLQLRAIRLVLERPELSDDRALSRVSGALNLVPRGYVHGFRTLGRQIEPRPVELRTVPQGSVTVYGTAAGDIRSEAVVDLDLGDAQLPALLVLGSSDPEHFTPGMATDLLELFARVCARLARSWMP